MAQQQQKSLPQQASKTALPTANLAALKLPGLPDKTYRGTRHRDGSAGVVLEKPLDSTNGRISLNSSRPLPLHLDVRDHSPTGFAWGYGGSGPAQLALALLIDATGNEALACATTRSSRANSWPAGASRGASRRGRFGRL